MPCLKTRFLAPTLGRKNNTLMHSRDETKLAAVPQNHEFSRDSAVSMQNQLCSARLCKCRQSGAAIATVLLVFKIPTNKRTWPLVAGSTCLLACLFFCRQGTSDNSFLKSDAIVAENTSVDTWRRTTDGWENMASWTRIYYTPPLVSNVHPCLLAGFQILASVGGLLAFSQPDE